MPGVDLRGFHLMHLYHRIDATLDMAVALDDDVLEPTWPHLSSQTDVLLTDNGVLTLASSQLCVCDRVGVYGDVQQRDCLQRSVLFVDRRSFDGIQGRVCTVNHSGIRLSEQVSIEKLMNMTTNLPNIVYYPSKCACFE